jgi:hemerythrin-like domain-containing protein
MRRHDSLRALSSDHHHALVLARRAREAAHEKDDAVPPAVLTEVVDRFAREIEPHFQLEEHGLIPALERTGDFVLSARAAAEHRAMRDIIATSNAHSARTTLLAIAEALERHVRFEERELFEHAQRYLDEATLRALDRAALAPEANASRAGSERDARAAPADRERRVEQGR